MTSSEEKIVETLIGIATSYKGYGARSEDEIILAIQKLSRYTHRTDVLDTLLRISKSKYGSDAYSAAIIKAAMQAIP